MRILEVLGKTPTIKPTVVSQHERVTQLVQKILASDQKQAPTEMDKVMAMRRAGQLKKQRDKQYADQLRQQLAVAQSAIK